MHMFDKQLIRGTAPWNRTTPTPEHLVTTTTQTNLFHAFELDRHGNIIGTLDRHGIWASLFRQVRWSRCFEVTQHAAELRGREVVSSSTKLIGRETKIVVPTKHQSTTTRKASQKECTCMYVRTPIKKERWRTLHVRARRIGQMQKSRYSSATKCSAFEKGDSNLIL